MLATPSTTLALRGWAAPHDHIVSELGEARAHKGKIEQSQALRYKRRGMSGLPWVLFWPENLLSPIMRSRSKRIVMQVKVAPMRIFNATVKHPTEPCHYRGIVLQRKAHSCAENFGG